MIEQEVDEKTVRPISFYKNGEMQELKLDDGIYVLEPAAESFRRSMRGPVLGMMLLEAGAVIFGGAALGTALADDAPVEDAESDLSLDSSLRLRGYHVSNRYNDADSFGTVDARVQSKLIYTPDDDLELGLRLAGEASSIPNLNTGLSEGYEVGVDRAYARWNGVTVGAFDNTFPGWMERSVPIVGGQVEFDAKDVLSLDQLAAKAAYHVGQPWIDESDTGLYLVELSGTKSLGDSVDIQVRLSYMKPTDLDENYIGANSKTESGEYAEDYDIINTETRLKFSDVNVPILEGPLQIYLKTMHNLSAEDDGHGVIGTVCLGKLGEPGDMLLLGEYRHIQQDATLAFLAPEHTSGSNFNQYVLALKRQQTENMKLFSALGLPKRLHSESTGNRQIYIAGGLEIDF